MDTKTPVPNMIPAGYMAKRVARRQDWTNAGNIVDICAVSGCISEDFADYTKFWRVNGWWFYNTPDIIKDAAAREKIDLTGVSYFYYEVHGMEYVEMQKIWRPIMPEASFVTQVQTPSHATLLGYDVVTFSAGNSAECSPLSCNGLAKTLPVNQHYLFADFDAAYENLEAGKFDHSEPGPFRIFAVYAL